jgi:RNA polymerase sigma factor (sigma-70 family)
LAEHLPIVRVITRCIHDRLPPHVPIEDLYSAGVLGLLDALGRFDPAKQVLFRTYAQFRIRGAILDSLRTLDWSPRQLRRKGRGVEQAIQLLTAQLHRSPSDIEITQKLNIPLDAYQLLLGELKGLEIGSLDSEPYEDSGEYELDLIPGRPDDDLLFRYLDGEMRDRLTKAINELPRTRASDHDPLLLRGNDDEGDRTYPWYRRYRRIPGFANSRLRRPSPSCPACYYRHHDTKTCSQSLIALAESCLLVPLRPRTPPTKRSGSSLGRERQRIPKRRSTGTRRTGSHDMPVSCE